MQKKLGIFGLGAFGKLMARHLAPHFDLLVCDPSPAATDYARQNALATGTMEEVAARDIVIVGVPVPKMEDFLRAVAPHVRKGALVLDIGSVKVKPALWMKEILPEGVDVVATHPLFGPQSAPVSIKGQKLAVCHVRGDKADCVIAFAKDVLELDVIVTTPEEHDREVAYIQGLTHMVGRILSQMGPLPDRMTTKSFDKLMESVNIVRHDSIDLFMAIERENPFSAEVRRKFFQKAEELHLLLHGE